MKMGLRARIVFASQWQPGSGLPEKPSVGSQDCERPRPGIFQTPTQINTAPLPAQPPPCRAPGKTLRLRINISHSKNLFMLVKKRKGKEKGATFHVSSQHMCLLAISACPVVTAGKWESKPWLRRRGVGGDLKYTVSFLSNSFYGLFLGRCCLFVFLFLCLFFFFFSLFWHPLCLSCFGILKVKCFSKLH